MRYMLMMCAVEAEEAAVPEAQMAEVVQGYMAVTEEMEQAGVLRDSNRLRPTTSATTLRGADGGVQITDGPFAETKEQIGGYYLIDVKDLDEAIAWAKKFPTVHLGGTIEIRPVWEMEDYESA